VSYLAAAALAPLNWVLVEVQTPIVARRLAASEQDGERKLKHTIAMTMTLPRGMQAAGSFFMDVNRSTECWCAAQPGLTEAKVPKTELSVPLGLGVPYLGDRTDFYMNSAYYLPFAPGGQRYHVS
jgi:hypothetical protein